MLKFSCLISICVLTLFGCANHEPKTFLEQRQANDWRLPSQIFNSPTHWDDQVDTHFSKAGCPSYLSGYIKKSSDIIEVSHVFPYADFNLNDDCVKTLMLFMKFYMHNQKENFSNAAFTLDLSNNPNLTNRSVAYMIDFLNSTSDIAHVDLSGNPRVGEDALAVLAKEGNVTVSG